MSSSAIALSLLGSLRFLEPPPIVRSRLGFAALAILDLRPVKREIEVVAGRDDVVAFVEVDPLHALGVPGGQLAALQQVEPPAVVLRADRMPERNLQGEHAPLVQPDPEHARNLGAGDLAVSMTLSHRTPSRCR